MLLQVAIDCEAPYFETMLHRALISLFATLVLLLPSQAQVVPIDTTAKEAILIDAGTGHVLFEKSADRPVPPASMSKLMTSLMVFEGVKSGTLKMDQTFTVSKNAWKRGGQASGGSTMYAKLNSKIALSNLIQGVIVQSANDACIVIAEGLAGSEEAFGLKMTARARELGLKNSKFMNATGLPNPEHYMSVRDLSILARYINANFPEFYKYYSQPEFTWNEINQKNRNPLLLDYPGADGMKTGFTKEAGYGLVGSATRVTRRLILVVAGLKSADERKVEATKLLDWGFSQIKTIDVYAKGAVVSKATVWGGLEKTVDLVASDSAQITLFTREQPTAQMKLHFKSPLIAPVKAGEKVGSIKFMVAGVPVAEIPVETAADVAANTSMWGRALDSVMIMALGN